MEKATDNGGTESQQGPSQSTKGDRRRTRNPDQSIDEDDEDELTFLSRTAKVSCWTQQHLDGDQEDGGYPLALFEDEHNQPTQRRELRSKYRQLINSVHENREEMLDPDSNKLTEVLCDADVLFEDVRQAQEAVLDSQLLVLASDLGKEKASQLHAEGLDFNLDVFAQHTLTFMGLNRLERQGDGDASLGYLPPDAWHRLGRTAAHCFRTAPTFHFMLGSFKAEPPPPKQRVERQRKAATKEVERVLPTQLKKMEESHQESTEKEVERILGYLRGYYADDPTSPISYFEFVIDPTSFSRTVENIFHFSFLIRDGLAKLYLDEHKLPCVAPVEEEVVAAGGPSDRQQCIVSIDYQRWKEYIEVFDITEPMIQPLTQSSQEPADSD